MELPKIGRIYLLVRGQKSESRGSGGLKRWWKNRRYSILCLKKYEWTWEYLRKKEVVET